MITHSICFHGIIRKNIMDTHTGAMDRDYCSIRLYEKKVKEKKHLNRCTVYYILLSEYIYCR